MKGSTLLSFATAIGIVSLTSFLSYRRGEIVGMQFHQTQLETAYSNNTARLEELRAMGATNGYWQNQVSEARKDAQAAEEHIHFWQRRIISIEAQLFACTNK